MINTLIFFYSISLSVKILVTYPYNPCLDDDAPHRQSVGGVWPDVDPSRARWSRWLTGLPPTDMKIY